MLPYALIWFATFSVIAFFAYGWDKRKAKKHRRRISEAFLLGIGMLGGALGALLGMLLFRHKTRHWYFWIANAVGIAWQAALCWFLLQ